MKPTRDTDMLFSPFNILSKKKTLFKTADLDYGIKAIFKDLGFFPIIDTEMGKSSTPTQSSLLYAIEISITSKKEKLNKLLKE